MHTPEIQKPQVGCWRGRYSDEFKRRFIVPCLELGVSAAAIALAYGLDANLARHWGVLTLFLNDWQFPIDNWVEKLDSPYWHQSQQLAIREQLFMGSKN